ncbi:MAG: UDP-3-O-(3-hydroxymyristoyl)glucosamine N-acyltransferase [Gemmatimonadota bacterium]|nr:UDP-3-O-(3-hydroxymyristoyl)glucosamine N-acyltransferase [Gemmatimonadota bacterium]
MSDPQSRTRAGEPLALSRIAHMVGGTLSGDGDLLVEGVAPLDEAGSQQVGFLALKRYVRFLDGSRAGAFLSSPELEGFLPAGAPRVVVADPYGAVRTLLTHFFPDIPAEAAVHPTAVLGHGVRLGAGVRIGPYAVLEEAVTVGSGTRIGAHAVLGARTSVGERCAFHPHVVTYPDSVVGSDVTVHAGACIGSDGFGYTAVAGRHEKMPQVGRAVIEDEVEIGANTTIDRGSLGDTVVGRGTKIDNLVQVAHNVRIGAGSLLAALVGIAGSTRIGNGVWIGGRASAINHLEIGDGAQVTFGSTVMRDVPPGETVSGSPSRPHREQMRRQAQLGRLDKLIERVRKLETLVS